MNSLVAPPNHNNGSSPEGGEVERVLRTFFRAEMPDPWPAFAAPEERPAIFPFRPASQRRRTLSRTRLALAASVALFLAGSWLLNGKFHDPQPAERRITTQGAATATKLFPGEAVLEDTPEGTVIKVPIFEEPPMPPR